MTHISISGPAAVVCIGFGVVILRTLLIHFFGGSPHDPNDRFGG